MNGRLGRWSTFTGRAGVVLLLVAAASVAWPSDWTAEQRAALGVLESACEALKQNKMEKLTPLYHERFVGWDLAQPLPSAREAFLKEDAAFLKGVKSFESKVTPIMIEVVDDTAALQVTYRNTVVTTDGQRQVSTGRWSTTLVKKGGVWVFLSSAFAADK
jgi:hypothetical protein